MIICAALKVSLNAPTDSVEIIMPCHRHGDGFKLIQTLDPFLHGVTIVKVMEQGFIDHKGTFLNRKEAYNHALGCGQLNQTTLWYKEDNCGEGMEPELYSEDLY